jgi:TDG/mug DNA glycosylase family protein
MKCVGLDPIADSDAHVLILGTLPSVISLERGQYYANPRNSFWWIIEKLAGIGVELPYCERVSRLKRCRIALWDVCRSGERSGSSDAKILWDTVQPNDFTSFLRLHPRIKVICFNGRPAEKIFIRRVLPSYSTIEPIPRKVLDSTSPAHSRITRETKLSRWREILVPVICRGTL